MSSRRYQATATLFAVLLFASGVLVGVLIHRYYSGLVVNAKTAETYREHYVNEMRSRVHLTDQQIDRLDGILDETKAKYKQLREQNRPEMMQIKQDQVRRVQQILTPEQQPLYSALVAEREKRTKEDEARDDREDAARAARRRLQMQPR